MPLQEFGDASSSRKVFSKKSSGGEQAADSSFPARQRDEVTASVKSSNVEADGSFERFFDWNSYCGDGQHTLPLDAAESNAFQHQYSPTLDADASQTSISGRLDTNDLLLMRDPWTAQGPRPQDQPFTPVEWPSDVYVRDNGALDALSWPDDTNVCFPNNVVHHPRQGSVAVKHASPLSTMTSGTPYSPASSDDPMALEGSESYGPAAFAALAFDQHSGGCPEPPPNQVYHHQAADSIHQGFGPPRLQEGIPTLTESRHAQASASVDPQRAREAEDAIQAAYRRGVWDGMLMPNTASRSTQLPPLSSAGSGSSDVFQSRSRAHNGHVVTTGQHSVQPVVPPVPPPPPTFSSTTFLQQLYMPFATTGPATLPPQQATGTQGNYSHYRYPPNEFRCVCSLVYQNISSLRRHIKDKTSPCVLCHLFGRKKRDGICDRCHGVCDLCHYARPSVKDIHRTTVCQGCASGGNPLQ